MSSVALAGRGVYDKPMPRQPRQSRNPDKLRAREAYELLDLPEHLFYRLVREGEIQRHVDPYTKLGYYVRAELLAFKQHYDDLRAHGKTGDTAAE